MAVVELIYDVKPYSYITSNPTKILSNGEPIYLSDGRYGFGDGITTLSSLPLYGGSGYAFTGLTSQYTRGDGTYATFPTNVSSFTNDSGYITSSALSPYLTIANAALTYQPIGSYLTGLTVGSTAIGSGTNTRILYNNAGVLGEYLVTGTGTTAVLSTSPTFTTDITTPLIIGGTGTNQVLTFQNTTGFTTSTGGAYLFKAGNLGSDLITINQGNFIFSPINATAGAITSFTFTTPANTSQTASTEISNFKVNGASKTWAAGAITTQRWNYFTANTAAFASASTITNSYGLYVEAATAGTNATITNNYALGLNGDISLEGGNRIIRGSNSIEIIHGAGSNYRVYTGSTVRVDRNPTYVSYYNGTATSGSVVGYLFTSSSNTGQTASTNIPNFKVTGSTKTWAGSAGAATLGTQYFNYFTANTVAFANANTATMPVNLYIEAPLAGTNCTATNLAALGIGGHCFIANSVGVPANNPTGGGLLYVEAGALKYRGSSGTVTTIAAA